MRLWPAALLLVMVCVLATPVPTWAATVSLAPATDSRAPYSVANYRASPGETNQLRLIRSMSPLGVAQIRVTDAGAPLAAGPGCTSLDAHTADCAPVVDAQVLYGTLWADARLGDGDDTAEAGVDSTTMTSLAGGNFDLWGEGGNDRLSIPSYKYYYGDLHGGPGDDVLHNLGYAGEQTLDGGPGSDEIVGGRGYDILRDGDPDDAPAPDTMDGGGSGFDVVSYEGNARSLRIDLEAGRGGTAGEGDRFTGVEGAHGGQGNDVIRGTPRAETLDGGGGRDFISGRAGGDTIVLDSGRAIGGPGDDYIRVRGVATIVCGINRDLVEELERPAEGPYLARDCEQLRQGVKEGYDTPTGITVDPRARLRADGRIRLPIRCGDCSRGRTRVTIARRPFRTLARDLFRLRPPDPNADDQSWLGSASVAVPAHFPKAARRRRVLLRFVLEARGEHAVWTVRLRVPRAANIP